MSGEIREFPGQPGKAAWSATPPLSSQGLRFNDVCAALGIEPQVPLEFEHRYSAAKEWEVRLIGDDGQPLSEWRTVRAKGAR